jgi:hypothetical protein
MFLQRVKQDSDMFIILLLVHKSRKKLDLIRFV